MTNRLVLPLVFLPLLAVAACGREVAVADELGEGDGTPQTEALEAPLVPPDGVALDVDDEELIGRIRVSDGEARFIARRAVPDGRLLRATLSDEDGRLVYTYDLEVDGGPGVTRVVVDALTARVVEGTH